MTRADNNTPKTAEQHRQKIQHRQQMQHRQQIQHRQKIQHRQQMQRRRPAQEQLWTRRQQQTQQRQRTHHRRRQPTFTARHRIGTTVRTTRMVTEAVVTCDPTPKDVVAWCSNKIGELETSV
ncbi:hypothetical protein [Halogeometricum borinquense]|uniref:hypothetical protein n=1 Tax=Halogeometricum borinquense TaxID=60847 RepID=UPI00344A20F6